MTLERGGVRRALDSGHGIHYFARQSADNACDNEPPRKMVNELRD